MLPGFKVEEDILRILLNDRWGKLLQKTLMIVGVQVLFAGLAEFFSTLVLVLLMTSEVNVLAAVQNVLEMTLADVLAEMIVETVLAAKHTTAVLAELSMIRNAIIDAVMALFADARTVVNRGRRSPCRTHGSNNLSRGIRSWL